MSQNKVATVAKAEPNIWRNAGTNNNNSSTTEQSDAQQNQSESESESEERLALIFKRLDRNGNGRIDIQELTSSLKRSGIPHQYAEVSTQYQFVLNQNQNNNGNY